MHKINLIREQKLLQTNIIDIMALSTCLEPRLGHIIGAGYSKDMSDAHVQIGREF